MDPVLLAIPLGFAIGLVVGAVGGGGALLALPVLIYVLGEEVGPASTASLIVVAIAAAVGAGALALRGHVCWRIAAAVRGRRRRRVGARDARQPRREPQAR